MWWFFNHTFSLLLGKIKIITCYPIDSMEKVKAAPAHWVCSVDIASRHPESRTQEEKSVLCLRELWKTNWHCLQNKCFPPFFVSSVYLLTFLRRNWWKLAWRRTFLFLTLVIGGLLWWYYANHCNISTMTLPLEAIGWEQVTSNLKQCKWKELNDVIVTDTPSFLDHYVLYGSTHQWKAGKLCASGRKSPSITDSWAAFVGGRMAPKVL